MLSKEKHVGKHRDPNDLVGKINSVAEGNKKND